MDEPRRRTGGKVATHVDGRSLNRRHAGVAGRTKVVGRRKSLIPRFRLGQHSYGWSWWMANGSCIYMYRFIYTYLYYECYDKEKERERDRERVPNNKARSTCGQFQQHTQTAMLLSCIEENKESTCDQQCEPRERERRYLRPVYGDVGGHSQTYRWVPQYMALMFPQDRHHNDS